MPSKLHGPVSLDKLAERMTATLARAPKKQRSRKLLASLPKRDKVVVTACDYIRCPRDDERYAAWAERGSPPSPPAKPKTRKRPSARQRPMEVLRLQDRLAMAQDLLCPGCGRVIDLDSEDDAERPSFDHVVPRSRGGGNEGNLLIMHRLCNGRKADRMPNGCELIWLQAVNAIMTT